MMRSVILGLVAATMMVGPAMAQDSSNWREDRREVRQDFREDRQDFRADRREVRDDFREDRRELRDDRREFREDGREFRGNRRDFRSDRRDYYQDQRRWRVVGQNDWRWSGPRYGGSAYLAPRGYRYQPWDVGYRVPRAFAAQRYWVANPGYYQLQPAWRGTRWVRYGPDALLIRTRDGAVVQAVRSLWR
jgi:Ni/Co efflux regulator RcnB